MPALPTFVVDTFRRQPDAEPIPLGPCDLTEPLIRAMTVSGDDAPALPTGLPTHYQISDALTGDAARAGVEGHLLIPGFVPGAAAFVESIGGLPEVPRLRGLFRRRSRARSVRDEASHLLDDVRNAEPGDATDWLFDPYHDVFAHGLAALYADWPVERFLRESPMPLGAGPDRLRAWEAAREAYRAAAMPPYAFGTLPDPWKGISADTLRDIAANGGKADPDAIDVYGLLDNELDEHFEGAREHVRDERALSEMIRSWAPHAGTGDAVDLALESEMAAWNARQSIVSHHADRSRLVLLGGRTKDDAIAFCEGRLAEAEAALAAAADAWSPRERIAA